MGMKFINAKFFYERSELIDTKYSYWWILMGQLKKYGSTLELASGANIRGDEWTELKGSNKSYNVVSSTSVTLKNAYICGIASTSAPVIGEDPNSMGSIVLTANGSEGNSIIPFTVGQENSTVGHCADSLWLLALSGSFDNINTVQNKLFPFVIDSSSGSSITTQKYVGAEYDISVEGNCIPLIGYGVSSDDAVNSINYSGFTVGTSVVTLSGLYSEAVN